MKRILHALAALWPERQEYHNTWLPDARNGLLRHAVAVLRVEHAMEELAMSKEPKTQPVNTPDTEPQTNDGLNNRLNLTSRLAGRRITVPGSSEIASLPAKAHLHIRVFANLQMACALATALFMCLTAAQQVFAQQAEPADAAMVEPLQIGDTIPEYLWHLPLQVVNHPEGKETITLNDYRGKLIILDFWATWCGACIATMPRIHQVEKEHATDIVIVPVTYEPADKVALFLSANKTMQPLGLFSVVGDETLRPTFPHRGIPHYAWISPEGDLGAVTTSERVNTQNIQFFLGGELRKIPVKKNIDANRPLFLSDAIELDDLAYYSIFTEGKYDGLPSGNRFRTQNGVVRGRAVTNSTILHLYEAAVLWLFQKASDNYNSKRIILDVEDPLEITLNPSPVYEGTYLTDNKYNYELIVPIEKADSLYEYMLRDLNRYTGYHGRIEPRIVKCFVLTKTADFSTIRTKGGKSENTLFYKKPSRLVNYPLDYLVKRMNSRKELPFVVVDETGFSGNIDLEFSGDLEVDTLKKELRAQGLDLTEEYRQLNMFILEDKTILSF